MRELDGKTISIGKLFSSEFFFVVPDYQRPFSWDEDNFNDLVTDILEADRGQQYFLGTLVLHEDKGKKIYSVVDGQQRLTSLSILWACLRDLITDKKNNEQIQQKLIQNANEIDGIPERPRLESKDYKIFKKLVLTPGGTNQNIPTPLPEPDRRYLKAVEIFKKKLTPLSQAQLMEFVKFLSQQCVVIYLATSTFDDAFRLFTIVNDRGKQLRRIDILKAENISPDVVTNEAIRQKISKIWEGLEKSVGEDNFENILHLIRLIYVQEKPQADLLKEFELRIFKKKVINKGEDFVNTVFEYVSLYKNIFMDFDVIDEKSSDWPKFASLIFIMDKEFAASEWRACILRFAQKFKTEKLYEFILKIEKVYLDLWVSGVRKDERVKKYIEILVLIDARAKPEDVISQIKYNELNILMGVTAIDFYEKGFAQYFLLRLELLASELSIPMRLEAKSIEHVFPVTPESTSKWVKDPRFSEIQNFINTIGNLVLLSRSKNSSASNYDFEDKKKKYLKPRVSIYPRSIQVLDEKVWTIDLIQKRTREIEAEILRDL